MASPSTESFTMPTSSAFGPSASSTVLVEPPSSISTSVGEKESVGAASSLSMAIISGGPMDMLPSLALLELNKIPAESSALSKDF